MGLPFKNSHARKRDQVLAIDLGGRMTKAVHLQRRGDKLNLVNFAIIETPAHDKALSAEALSDHLKEISRVLGVRAKQVTLALGVADTIFRQVELPLMPVTDLRQMLKYNSKNYLQQELPDHVFDCCYALTIAGTKPAEGAKPNPTQKYKVIVGAAKRQTIDDVHNAIKTAGLLADQVVPSLIGPVNAFELAEPEAFTREVVALVDFGFRNTSITILDSGEIMLNRVVAIGGDHITAGLADALSISYQEAEGIKVGMPGEVQQNLEPILHPLGRELRASIDFFENQQDKTVSKVFLSGGSARSEMIVQILQNELMVPCEVWNPTKSLQLTLPPERAGEIEQAAPQLTVALGAAASAF
jgi:type IV pilus assembly protein PilM